MTKTSLLAAVLLGLGSAASAQSLDQAFSDAQAAARRSGEAARAAAAAPKLAAQGAPQEYAKNIVCAGLPKDANLGDLKFYTALDGKPITKIAADDTAYQLDDYHSSGIQDGKWRYNAWSCDSWDYYFTFDAQSLLKTTAGETSRPVKGHVREEVRGQVEWEGDIDCTAWFVNPPAPASSRGRR